MKNLSVLTLLILTFLVSCGIKPGHIKFTQKDLDSTLCRQSLSVNKCPDSSYAIKLDGNDLHLVQSFYGSGDGNGIYYYLVKYNSDTIQYLDSIHCNWDDDLAKAERIVYDFQHDWFIGTGEGSGSGDLSLSKTIYRIKDNKFIQLFEYADYWSMVDPDTNPKITVSVDNEILQINKDEIILQSRYEEGYINANDDVTVTKTVFDTATFAFNLSCGCFNWQKSSNTSFEKYWKGEDFPYPEFNK